MLPKTLKEIAFQLIGRSRLVGTEITGNFEAGLSGFKASETNKISERTFENLDLNAAASLLIESAASRPGKTIVVIDEFEALPSNTDRHLFAELVKQLSDRRATIALIFCGIGASLDDLLKGHNSAHRYLQEAKLPTPPLTFSGSWEIIDSAANALGLQLNDDSRLRIAQVSDGFPHYVHLICDKLFWIAYRADIEITFLTPEHYVEAVTNALTGVEARLREIYDRAVKKENDEYQAILWAVADHFELERNIKMIYSNSYVRIMESIGRIPLPIEKFTSHLTSLKSNTHGNILSSSRRGWIRFSENLVRGYVRLVAESKGISLAMEHEPSPDPKYSVWMNKGSIGKAPGYSLPNYNWKSR